MSIDWKKHLSRHPTGYYELISNDTRGVPVRFFVNEPLIESMEESLYQQVINATQFPGTRLVVITPDVHVGYGVPVGCVIVTDGTSGAVAMGPVGFDIGCGMVSARSNVLSRRATFEKRLQFNQEVIRLVEMGKGGKGRRFLVENEQEFMRLLLGGADYYFERYGGAHNRKRTERNCIPLDPLWKIPWGGKGRPERGLSQLGSLGGGNHFIELQRSLESDTLFVQIHTGSRGFGHGLATYYLEQAKKLHGESLSHIDLGYFTPDNALFDDYLNAVAAGGNYAIINRIILFEAVSEAFKKVFREELELVYEISHNLVQREFHDEYGHVLVHRKGATRAFPGGHPGLKDTEFYETGHPVLIPGSNKDFSYILRPLSGAAQSAYSVNHGAGRRLSRGEATRRLVQKEINRQYEQAGVVVNLNGDVPLDEAAACYKPIESVLQVVLDASLAKVEHSLWPLASLKGTD